jgi:hypothetical protein
MAGLVTSVEAGLFAHQQQLALYQYSTTVDLQTGQN